MDIKEVSSVEQQNYQHWYYTCKKSALLKLIENNTPSYVLDIGAGSGYFTKSILDDTEAVSAICIDSAYTKTGKENYNGKQIAYYNRIEDCNKADLLLLMDVLEHVDDDKLFLETCLNAVSHNTYVVVTVPAFQFLWSTHDIFLDHKRRYTLNGLEHLLKEMNVERIRGCYYFSNIFPLVAIIRLFLRFFKKDSRNIASDLRINNRYINKLFQWICYLEKFYFKYNRLFGLTVFYYGKVK